MSRLVPILFESVPCNMWSGIRDTQYEVVHVIFYLRLPLAS